LFSGLFPAAYIELDDPAYHWIMAFLAQDPIAQAQIHHFQLNTAEWRILRKKGNQGPKRAKDAREQNASWKAKEILGQVMPAYSE
jgi:chaperone BCS1